MGLRETIQAQVTTAFSTVGNLKESVTIQEQTSGSYDETTGTVTRNTSNHVVNAVIVTPSRREMDNPMILATDLMVLWDPAEDDTFEPQVNMRVLRGTDEYHIIHVDAVAPADGGPALLWKMAVRRTSAEAA